MAALTLFDHALTVAKAPNAAVYVVDRRHAGDIVISPAVADAFGDTAPPIHFVKTVGEIDTASSRVAVVRGGCADWPCVNKWSIKTLSDDVGDAIVSVLPDESDVYESMPLRAFLKRLGDDSPDLHPPYLRGWRFEEYVAVISCFKLVNPGSLS